MTDDEVTQDDVEVILAALNASGIIEITGDDMNHEVVAERQAPVTAQSLLAERQAAEQKILNQIGDLLAERHKCLSRSEEIGGELKALGWKPQRKPRTKKG